MILAAALALCVPGLVVTFESPAAAAETADWLPFKIGDGVVQVGCTWDNGCGGGDTGLPPGYHVYPAIDFLAPIGTAVYATGVGTVTDANGTCMTNCDTRGRYVEITHADGRTSRYLHLSVAAVSIGATVTRGQQIGLSGDTMANGIPHLHYDEFLGGARVDPGPMFAIHNGTTVQYPDVLGFTSWSSVLRGTAVWSEGFNSTRMMYINGVGAAFVKDTLTAPWSQQAGGGDAQAVAVGAAGRMAYINGCGALSVKDAPADQWSQQSGCADAAAVSVGMNRMAFITGCGGVGVKDSFAANWSWQVGCNDARAVRVSANEHLAYINGCGAAFVKANVTDPWSQQTGCNDARDIAIGGADRIALINGCGALFVKDGLASGWSQQTGCNDAQKVSVGKAGRMAYINGCGAGYIKDDLAAPWSQQAGCNDTRQLTVGGGTGAIGLVNGCGSLAIKMQPADPWSWQTGCNDATSVAIQ